jgi:hypothetical protein
MPINQKRNNSSTAAANPLLGHFRQATVFIDLPSQGDFWPPGSISIPDVGGIPIRPMTVQDEITLKMPEALMSGAAVTEVITSCCPAIHDPWSIPNTDLDALLIGIRIASYGETMEFTTRCPGCQAEHSYEVNLYDVLNSIRCADYHNTHDINGLTFKFRPQTYRQLTEVNRLNFEETRFMQSLERDDISEEQKNKIAESHINKLVKMNVNILANSTDAVILPDGTEVTDHQQILEYYDNIDMRTVRRIQEIVTDLARDCKTPDQSLTCPDCGNVYSTPLDFDYSSFFA